MQAAIDVGSLGSEVGGIGIAPVVVQRAGHDAVIARVCVADVRERAAAQIRESLGTLPGAASRVGVVFEAGCELCCDVLAALSDLADRCALAGGRLVVAGVGPETRRVIRTVGLERRFRVVAEPSQLREALHAPESSRPTLWWLFRRAA